MAKYHPDKIIPDESEVQGETDETNQSCSKCGKNFDNLISLAEHLYCHCNFILKSRIFLGLLSDWSILKLQ